MGQTGIATTPIIEPVSIWHCLKDRGEECGDSPALAISSTGVDIYVHICMWTYVYIHVCVYIYIDMCVCECEHMGMYEDWLCVCV